METALRSAGSVGIFDSGVGGFSVLRHIRHLLPLENLLYFADSGFAPYGTKTEEFVVNRSFKITDFLLSKGIKALVVACNTATAMAIHLLRAAYPDLPIVGVEPGLKPAALKTITGVVGVLATVRTLESYKFHVLHKQLQAQTGVRFVMQACPGLADLIEKADLDSKAIYDLLRQYLEPVLAAHADILVLGCTHYPFALHVIEKLAEEAGKKKPRVIDTGYAVARQLKHLLDIYALSVQESAPHTRPNGGDSPACQATTQVFTSGDAEQLASLIPRLLHVKLPVFHVHLPETEKRLPDPYSEFETPSATGEPQ